MLIVLTRTLADHKTGEESSRKQKKRSSVLFLFGGCLSFHLHCTCCHSDLQQNRWNHSGSINGVCVFYQSFIRGAREKRRSKNLKRRHRYLWRFRHPMTFSIRMSQPSTWSCFIISCFLPDSPHLIHCTWHLDQSELVFLIEQTEPLQINKIWRTWISRTFGEVMVWWSSNEAKNKNNS